MSQHHPTDNAALEPAKAWETEGGNPPNVEQAEKLGVTRHMTETYTVGRFRYTSLTDAVAEAHRMIEREREPG